MPLEMLITGRIATLAGERGFGWVEAVGIRDGRIAFAGSEVALETRADPFTERIALEPDEVAIPGLTDAHLHLAGAADATRQIDLSDAADAGGGAGAVSARRTRRAGDPDAWLEGHGWDVDRWGRWPTADDLETVAPGRRAALWAHDHHALLASRAALTTAGVDRATADPSGGVIRRDGGRRARGCPVRGGHPARHASTSRRSPAPISRDGSWRSRWRSSRSAWWPRTTRARSSPDPDLDWSYPAYAHLSELGRLPVRVLASLRDDALETALGRRAAQRRDPRRGPDGPCPDRLAEVLRRWVARVADGGAARATSSRNPIARSRPSAGVACGSPSPSELRERVARAAAGGIATQIHGDRRRGGPGRARRRSSRRPRRCRSCPGSSTSSCWTRPIVGRFAAAGIAASVQPVAPGSDAAAGSTAVGRPGRDAAATPGRRSPRPGPSSRSGRTRRSSRSIRGPGSRSRSVARIRAGRPARRRSRPARR